METINSKNKGTVAMADNPMEGLSASGGLCSVTTFFRSRSRSKTIEHISEELKQIRLKRHIALHKDN